MHKVSVEQLGIKKSRIIIFTITVLFLSFTWKKQALICHYYFDLSRLKSYNNNEQYSIYNIGDSIFYRCSFDGISREGLGKINFAKSDTSFGYHIIDTITYEERFVPDTSIVYEFCILSEISSDAPIDFDYYPIIEDGKIIDSIKIRKK